MKSRVRMATDVFIFAAGVSAVAFAFWAAHKMYGLKGVIVVMIPPLIVPAMFVAPVYALVKWQMWHPIIVVYGLTLIAGLLGVLAAQPKDPEK